MMVRISFDLVGRARLVVGALSTALFLTVAPAWPVGAAPPALFDAPPVAGAQAAADEHGSWRGVVLRQRAAKVKLGLLVQPDGAPATQPGDQIDLNLFSDAWFTMTVHDVARSYGQGHTWHGALDGIDHGYATLAVQDGAVAGQVSTQRGTYRIGSDSSGTLVVEQIDQSALPREGPERVPPPSRILGGLDTTIGAEILDIAADTAAQIDVMVLYTPAARAAAGGAAAMQAAASLGVALANGAYANTNLVQRLRPVYIGEITFTENTGPDSFDDDLDALSGVNPSSTLGATVARLRELTRADVVSLITEHGPSAPYCGLGFLMKSNSTGFAPSAFSVVERTCANSIFTFVHEIGHNMGAHHDPFVSVGEATVFPYSHGYIDTVGRFRTIMAYADQCTSIGFFNCDRIQMFSSPLFSFNGRVVGTAATSDNSRTLSQTANTVASFRQALVGQPTSSTGVNKTVFAVGETLTVSVNLQNTGRTGMADIYFGLLAPDNSVAFFTDVAVTPGGGYAFGNFLNFASYRPIATGIPLPTPFSVNIQSFVSYKWTGGEPRGGYALLLLVVTAGALADGVLATNELLGASLTPFSFPP